MAKSGDKTKKPYTVDVVRYGSELASLKRNKPKQFKKLRKIARARGVTLPSLVSGAPPSLQEKSAAGIRRQASNTIRQAYKPMRQELNRRERAAEALRTKQAADQVEYEKWLDGELGKLGAQAHAADQALDTAQERTRSELVSAQAQASTQLAQRLQAAGLISNADDSTAMQAVAEGQQHSLERESNARAYTDELQKLGSDSITSSLAMLAATAATRRSEDATALTERSAQIAADRQQMRGQQAADAADLRMQLRGVNRENAGANREFSLAMSQLGLKRSEIAASLKEAQLDYQLDRDKFNLDKWIAKNRVRAEELKRELEYDKIKAQDGRAAADRALRERIRQDQKEAREDKDKGPTAAERKAIRETYSTIQTIKTTADNKFRKGKTESQVRMELIRAGATDTQVDVAFDLRRHNGNLSSAGIRKAKLAGIPHPLRFWTKYTAPVAGQGK